MHCSALAAPEQRTTVFYLPEYKRAVHYELPIKKEVYHVRVRRCPFERHRTMNKKGDWICPRDSNTQPSAYKAAALPIELRQQVWGD